MGLPYPRADTWPLGLISFLFLKWERFGDRSMRLRLKDVGLYFAVVLTLAGATVVPGHHRNSAAGNRGRDDDSRLLADTGKERRSAITG